MWTVKNSASLINIVKVNLNQTRKSSYTPLLRSKVNRIFASLTSVDHLVHWNRSRWNKFFFWRNLLLVNRDFVFGWRLLNIFQRKLFVKPLLWFSIKHNLLMASFGIGNTVTPVQSSCCQLCFTNRVTAMLVTDVGDEMC